MRSRTLEWCRLSPLQSGTRVPSGTWLHRGNLPGHHKELVDLLVHKWVVCLPHLGLQLGLVTAILLTYGEKQGGLKSQRVLGGAQDLSWGHHSSPEAGREGEGDRL